ncbi:hypothetical protein HMPREF0208_05023 [Citrobacter koseri]|nr:hypothetical protein HMPREF0208_05023 [Citrobacter koseri]
MLIRPTGDVSTSADATRWLFFAKSVVTRNKSGCRSHYSALRC